MQLPPRCFEYSEEEEFLILLDELIDELDEEHLYRTHINDFCGLKYNNKLTQKALERSLDEIVEWIEALRFKLYFKGGPYGKDAERELLRLYYVLAILIFKTGSAFPDKVKDEVLTKRIDWVEEMGGLDYFRQKVREHIPGTPLRKDVSKVRHKRAQDYKAFEKMLDNIFPRKKN